MANWVSAPSKKQTKTSTWVTATGEISDYSPEVHQQAAYEAITSPVLKNTSGIMDPIKRQQQIAANVKGFDNYAEMQSYNKNNPHLSEVMSGQKYEPIPSKNPTVLSKEGQKLVDEAIASDDAYKSNLKILQQKKTAAQKAKTEYEKASDWFASFKDNSGNIVTDILDLGPSRYKDDYKDDYEKTATEYVTTKFYSKESAEKELSKLESKLKSVKDKTEKQELKNEIDIMRTGLYGKYSVGEHIWANVDAGAAQVNKSISATADFLVGNVLKALGWENNPITKWDNWHQKYLDEASQKAYSSARSVGDNSNISGQVIQGVTAALPDAILAMITGGTSAATSTIGTVSKTTGTLNMIRNAITTTAKNPSYWFSFTRELGTNYQEAKKDGATESEATLYALLSSTVNAAVEVGGGIQTLPESLQSAYKTGKLLEWFKSSLEEGGEEMLQSIISGLTEKITYNQEKEVFSMTNDEAIINPLNLLKEGAMGVAVGAILGGGQLSINTILNAKTESDYRKLGKAVLSDKNIDIQGILDYSSKSLDSGIRQLALDTTLEKITSRTAGILYQHTVSDIQAAINSPTDIDTVTENFSNILESTDSQIIKSIASSQYVLRLIKNGMTEDVANEHIENINSSLQNSDNSDKIADSDTNDVRSENVSPLTATEKELLNTPDNELTPEQTAVKQTIAEKQTPILQSSANGGDVPSSAQSIQSEDIDSGSSENDIDGDGSVFTNSKPADIHREDTKAQIFKTINGKPINDIQKQIEALCNKFGIKLIWSTNVKRGKYRPADNVMLMNPNQALPWMYAQIFKHEFVHYLKYRKDFAKFKKELFENSPAFVEYIRGRLLKVNGVEFEGSDQEAIEEYTKFKYNEYRNSTELTEIVRRQFSMEDAQEEVIADFVGDMLFGSLDYDESVKLLQKLSTENPGVIMRIREWLKSLIERLKGEKQNNTVATDVARLEKMLERVLQSKELDRTGGVEKNLIAVSDNGKKYVVVDPNAIDLNNGNSIAKNIAIILKKKFENLILVNGQYVRVNAKTNSEFTGSDWALALKKEHPDWFGDKIQTLAYADEILKTAKGWINRELKHSRNDKITSFGHGEILYKVGNNGYSAEVIVGLKDDGSAVLYDIIKISDKKIVDTNSVGKGKTLSGTDVSTNNNVSRNTEKVNEKNSIITPNKVSTEKLSKKILRNNRSSYGQKEVEKSLNYIFSLIGESNWGMAYEYALDVARSVLESSKFTTELSDDAVELLHLIRTTPVRLDSVQKAEAAISYGSYNNFGKSNKGRINIKNDAVPLETAWREWSDEFPNIFDPDTNPADMAPTLATIIDTLKGQFVDFDMEGAIQSVASRIMNEAADAMYNPLSKQLQEAVAETKKIYEKQHIEDVRFMAQQKAKNERLKGKLQKRRSEVAEEYAAKRDEKATKQKNIEHIRKVVARIDRKLRTNSAKEHIPQDLKPAMADFVKIFLNNDTSPFNKKDLNHLKTVYKNAVFESENNVVFDEGIAEDLKTLEERLEGKTLRELNYYDTLLVKMIVDHFSHILSMENEMFVAGKKYEIDQIGNAALRDVSNQKAKRTNFLIDGVDKVKYSNMTPIYFFDRLGGTFKKLFNDILHGQDKWYKNVEISKTYITEIKEKYHYDKWDLKEKLKLKTVLGDEIEITREQAMLLYATAKREYGNNFQESEHLFKGGIVIEPSKKTIEGVIKQLGEKGADTEKIIKAFTSEVNAKRHRITPADAGTVKNWLTEEQRAYADAFVEYLSKDMASLGNEISMQLYGINKFNEDYYIPYNSAANYLYSQPGITNDSRIKHQSFTKETQRHANTPLVLSDFSSVCADHINRMCMYNAMTVPLENMTKIFNYQKFKYDDNGGKEMSTDIKAEIANAYGSEAVDYIKQFLEDMNGNVRISTADKFLNRAISKFKKGAVFASASVVVQQPSAIMRAMAYVNPKYFVKTSFSFAERNYQEAIRYASVAGIKDMGRFDTGVGAATTNWLLQQTPKGLKNKAKAFFGKDSTYRDDKLSYFAAKADEITWSHIWAAVKAEISDTTEFKVDSEEFLEACGKRFTEVINYTQVYDSTLSRSQLMRDKSTSAQMLTAFMSEPTVSLNMLVNAMHEAKKGTAEGKKFAVRAVSAFVGNVILNAILKSLVTAGRDDDEEKSYWEKYLGDVGGNIVSDLNPMGLIPVLKDIVSVFEGYTVERVDMSLFSDLSQSVNIILNDKKTLYEKIESISGSLAAFLGLPVKNVLRDFKMAYNLYKDFFKIKNETTTEGIKYSVVEEITGKDSNKHYYEQMIKAIDTGNYKKYNEIFKYLQGKGIEEKKIYSGIKSAYKNSKETKTEVKKQISVLANNDTYNSFDQEEKEKVENTIKTAVATENLLESTAKKHCDDFDRLYEYKRKGNKKARERLIQELLKKGLTQSQINDGETIAKYAYLKSIGIDLSAYAMAQIAVSKNNADLDGSGGVSNAEKRKAINNMDVDDKTKTALKRFYN